MGSVLSKKKVKIVLLGLAGSGKTTILYRLAYDAYTITSPTVMFNKEEFHRVVDGIRWRFEVWDVAGSQKQFWRNYVRRTHRIALAALVVDASDVSQFEEVRHELTTVARSCDCLALVINKQDLREAFDTAAIQRLFGAALRNGENTIPIIECCAITGEGLTHLLRLAVARSAKSS